MSLAVSAPDDYPVRFDVDYPERRDRLSVLLRLLLIVPIVVVYALLAGGSDSTTRVREDEDGGWRTERTSTAASAGGIVVLPTVLMLLFRRKYPRWWFEWNRELSRFGARVGAYALLLRDEYPSTDEEQAVHLAIDDPDATRLSRWLPLVKWLLAIPHYLVILFLVLAMMVTTLIAWFAIIVTGRYPRGLFEFAVGVARWCYRVSGYAFLLVTDRYPPFSLK